MRKYLKPALEIEAFDVEDLITASDIGGNDNPNNPDDPNNNNNPENHGQGQQEGGTGYGGGLAAAPIDMIELN